MHIVHAWWRHDMEMPSTLLALCEGNPLGTGGSPHKRPGPCITNVFATRRKNFSQWYRSFQRKLLSHWLKFLRHVAITLVIQGPVMQSIGVFFVISRNKLSNIQSSCWRFETPWHPWNATVMGLPAKEHIMHMIHNNCQTFRTSSSMLVPNKKLGFGPGIPWYVNTRILWYRRLK